MSADEIFLFSAVLILLLTPLIWIARPAQAAKPEISARESNTGLPARPAAPTALSPDPPSPRAPPH